MPRSAGLFESPDTLALDWKGLYQEHAPRLRRIAERRVGTEHADDVVQDTFMRAFRNRTSLDPSRPIGAWLSSITLCSSTDALRRRSARPELPVDAEPEAAVVGQSVEDEFDNMVRRVGIEQAFESLNQRQRRVLKRLEVDGWTQEEVAAVEQLTPEAVKSLAARARRTFREAYSTFAENMGVFGGATLGPAMWRLRARLQRLQAVASEHVGAFGMAAATVTVVAIATVPTARPAPTSAAEAIPGESTAADTAADAHLAASVVESAALPELPAPPAPPAAVGATASAPAPAAEEASTKPGPDGSVEVQATTSARRNGSGASAGLSATESAGDANKRTYAGVTVTDCDANVGTTLECAAIDFVAQGQEGPP